jgi:hypothetical protein
MTSAMGGPGDREKLVDGWIADITSRGEVKGEPLTAANWRNFGTASSKRSHTSLDIGYHGCYRVDQFHIEVGFH